MGQRVWLDTLTINSMENAVTVIDELLERDKDLTFVTANTLVDMRPMQQNYAWTEEMLHDGRLIIEIWNTPDEMVKKAFLWSSCDVETQASGSFAEAVANLPNKIAVETLADMVGAYGIAKGDWPMGEWAPPEPLSADAQSALELTEAATRTEVLEACKAKSRMDLFDEYNAGYNRGLARQHTCDAILGINGEIIPL